MNIKIEIKMRNDVNLYAWNNLILLFIVLENVIIHSISSINSFKHVYPNNIKIKFVANFVISIVFSIVLLVQLHA